jgi:hypothetical protein
VLQARWEWFQTKQGFEGGAGCSNSEGPGEGQQQKVVATVDASEHSAETMQQVLQHLYTGSASLQQQGSQQRQEDPEATPIAQLPLLLEAASYFQLPDLHTACLQLAVQHLSPANALQWLLVAHKAGKEELEQAAMAYTLTNLKGEVAKYVNVAFSTT